MCACIFWGGPPKSCSAVRAVRNVCKTCVACAQRCRFALQILHLCARACILCIFLKTGEMCEESLKCIGVSIYPIKSVKARIICMPKKLLGQPLKRGRAQRSKILTPNTTSYRPLPCYPCSLCLTYYCQPTRQEEY